MAVLSQATWLKRFVSALRQWPVVLGTVCVLAVDVLDSFGLDQGADEQVARIIGTMAAPVYATPEHKGQKAITVVLIDDVTLDTMHWPHPVPYRAQAELAETVAQFSPQAIFFDFSYLRPHEDANETAADITAFAESLTRISQNGGPPVFIGDVGDDPALAPLRQVRQVGVRWIDQSWLNYPMVAQQEGDTRPAGQRTDMAARALYQVWCENQPRDKCDPELDVPPKPALLSLTWGFGSSPLSAEVNGFSDAGHPQHYCMRQGDGLAARLSVSGSETWGAFTRGLNPPDAARRDLAEARCIYTDNLNAATVMAGADYEALEKLLKDRVVLIGASHRESNDLQSIPHIGVVPGVFVHAMALDNLIEQGRDFTRPPPDGFLRLDFGDMIEILLTIILFCSVWIIDRKLDIRDIRGSKAPGERRKRRAIAIAAYVGLGVTFVLATAALEHWILHWPPLNVVGIIALIAVVFSYFDKRPEPNALATIKDP